MFDLCTLLLFTASMMYQYFVKIVPTIYVKGDGEVRELSYWNVVNKSRKKWLKLREERKVFGNN